METSISTHQKNVSTFIHLSTFSKYFFPFGNFIAPLILWSAQKRHSTFIDEHGRGAINFQLSMLLYLIAVAVISIPFFVYQLIVIENADNSLLFNGHIDHIGDLNQLSGVLITAVIVGALLTALFFVEIISVISAAVKASSGGMYKYPFTINFIKEFVIVEESPEENSMEQSKSI